VQKIEPKSPVEVEKETTRSGKVYGSKKIKKEIQVLKVEPSTPVAHSAEQTIKPKEMTQVKKIGPKSKSVHNTQQKVTASELPPEIQEPKTTRSGKVYGSTKIKQKSVMQVLKTEAPVVTIAPQKILVPEAHIKIQEPKTTRSGKVYGSLKMKTTTTQALEKEDVKLQGVNASAVNTESDADLDNIFFSPSTENYRPLSVTPDVFSSRQNSRALIIRPASIARRSSVPTPVLISCLKGKNQPATRKTPRHIRWADEVPKSPLHTVKTFEVEPGQLKRRVRSLSGKKRMGSDRSKSRVDVVQSALDALSLAEKQ